MTFIERRAIISLSSVMSLRMIGLFMILPVFSLYTNQLAGSTPTLIGVALGIYGLTQGVFQIPFGMLSDHIGRKKMIVLGLILFTLGSLIAAFTHSMVGMILARALQGTGAVGSTIIAMLADLTSEKQRTKAMAGMGISIGLSFSVAFVMGPVLLSFTQVPGMFLIGALLSLVAIFILLFIVPKPAQIAWHADTEPEPSQFIAILKHGGLARLNIGIFILHAILTASFVAIPLTLRYIVGLQNQQQWLLYFPVLLLAFCLTIPIIVIAEKKQRVKTCFVGAILLLGAAECVLWTAATTLWRSGIGLLLFFTAFSILEAFLPSLVSRMAPPSRKGTALGIYSSAQFLGIFVGGLLGGWLYGLFGLTNVYLFCLILCLCWAIVALFMKLPQTKA